MSPGRARAHHTSECPRSRCLRSNRDGSVAVTSHSDFDRPRVTRAASSPDAGEPATPARRPIGSHLDPFTGSLMSPPVISVHGSPPTALIQVWGRDRPVSHERIPEGRRAARRGGVRRRHRGSPGRLLHRPCGTTGINLAARALPRFRGQPPARTDQPSSGSTPHTNQLARLVSRGRGPGFHHLPPSARAKICSTNPSSGSTKKVKRRARVVGIYPNPAAAIRFVGVVLADMHNEWRAGEARRPGVSPPCTANRCPPGRTVDAASPAPAWGPARRLCHGVALAVAGGEQRVLSGSG